MTQRAPKSFLVLLTIGLICSTSLGVYLEQRQLAWLQNHPISVNLISGVIGFCGGFLTVAIVYNWLLDADWARKQAAPTIADWYALIRPISDATSRYNRHSSAITLANVNWAPINPSHDAVSFDGMRNAAAKLWNVGEAKKPDILAFIQKNLPAGRRTAAAAKRLFDQLDEAESVREAEKALERLSIAVEADLRKRYRLDRRQDIGR